MAIFSERIFDFWKPKSTRIVPKRGMLVCWICDYERKYSEDETKRWVLIVDAIVDEYGNCKFGYLTDTKIKWTSWMTCQEFNDEYEIKNPWI